MHGAALPGVHAVTRRSANATRYELLDQRENNPDNDVFRRLEPL
jgi:hypothetical protein